MFRFLLQNDVVQNKDIFFKLWDIVTNPAKKRVLIREGFFNKQKKMIGLIYQRISKSLKMVGSYDLINTNYRRMLRKGHQNNRESTKA